MMNLVALLAEGVDRNDSSVEVRKKPVVALLAEGVDRNFNVLGSDPRFEGSPSSRRAWIEM